MPDRSCQSANLSRRRSARAHRGRVVHDEDVEPSPRPLLPSLFMSCQLSLPPRRLVVQTAPSHPFDTVSVAQRARAAASSPSKTVPPQDAAPPTVALRPAIRLLAIGDLRAHEPHFAAPFTAPISRLIETAAHRCRQSRQAPSFPVEGVGPQEVRHAADVSAGSHRRTTASCRPVRWW